MMRRPSLAACLGAAAAGALMATIVAATPARAQIESREGIRLENEILELRHQIEQLRAQGGGGGGDNGGAPPAQVYAPPPAGEAGGDISAQLLDRVSQLEDQVRTLRGRIDEIDNARQQAEADLAKQIGDLQFKLNGGAGAPPGPAAPTLGPPAGVPGQVRPPAVAPPAAPPLRRTPEVALAAGNAALAKRDYAAAEAAAREVLAAQRGPRTTDAQFLLAQALAGQRNWAAAAVAYDDTYTRNRRGNRAPESLLGLANSLTALGDKQAACQTLAKLRVEFPAPPGGLRPAIAAARGRAACR